MNCSLQVLPEEDGCGQTKNNDFGMLSWGVSTNFLLISQNSLWYQILVTYMYIP
jgi:hypothetical protein